MVELKDLDYSNFENALKSLKDALCKDNLNELERDGVIQRFEYTFELAWKMMRKTLVAFGRNNVSSSPKPIFRDAMEEGLIVDVKKWFGFLEARNLSSHIYSQDESDKVFNATKDFFQAATELLKKLKRLK